LVLKNNNNQEYDSEPAAYLNGVGGNYQKWNLEIENISQRLESNIPDGMDMEDYLDVILKTVNRTEFPIILDPKTATFDDVAIHGIFRQRLGKDTV
jgi:hypothetical protein